MLAELMGFEVEFRLENNKLLLEALLVGAEEMVVPEVSFQCVVVPKVVRLPRVSSIADKTPLMLVTTMLVEFIVIVESLTAEAAKGMTLETCLVDGTGSIITTSHMLLQLFILEKFMFMGENFLVSSTEVAHLLMMDGLDMPMQVLPTKSSEVACRIRAVVSK